MCQSLEIPDQVCNKCRLSCRLNPQRISGRRSAEIRSGAAVCRWLFGRHSLLLDRPNWPVVDPIFVALPLSLAVLVVVSLVTTRPSGEHLSKCFHGHKS